MECGPTTVTITSSLTDSVHSGKAFTLQCSASDPTESHLTYQWLKNSNIISMKSSTLQVGEVVYNEVNYTCQVSNRVGESSATVTIPSGELV